MRLQGALFGAPAPAPVRRELEPGELEGILELELERFDESGLVVSVFSSVLGEEILFTSDRFERPPGEGRAIYTRRELEAILEASPSPRELRFLHDAKTVFDGRLELERGRR